MSKREFLPFAFRADIGTKANLIRNRRGEVLASLWRGGSAACQEEQDDITHLMSAAPDLRNAVEALVKEIENAAPLINAEERKPSRAVLIARRALARADGRPLAEVEAIR